MSDRYYGIYMYLDYCTVRRLDEFISTVSRESRNLYNVNRRIKLISADVFPVVL